MSLRGNAEGYQELRGSLSVPEAIQGKSAYEIALLNGFEGTEQEWLDSFSKVDHNFVSTSKNPQSGMAVAEAISAKQNKLIDGLTIKTFNGESILGYGDLEISTGIPVTKSGQIITFEDMSPTAHGLNIQFDLAVGVSYGDVLLKLYGKNLFKVQNVTYWGGDKLEVAQLNADGSITFKGEGSGSFNYSISYNKLPTLPPGRYILSCSNKNLNATVVVLQNGVQNVYVNQSFEYKEGDVFQHFQLRPKNATYSIDDTVYLQLEANDAATEYEPYTEPITATVNNQGVVQGITNISNNNTLLTNTSRVTIECTYNADTKLYIDNKFAKLASAILNS